MTYIELLMLLKLKLNIIVQALVVVFFAEVMCTPTRLAVACAVGQPRYPESPSRKYIAIVSLSCASASSRGVGLG